MKSDSPILSILITSHNQVHLLGRCLDSVLRQQIRVPYEVLVSDDRSSDGTWELIQRYEKEYPVVRGYQVNSDEIHPTMGLERAGWNKANVYSHARGKYVVNLDGDDYLIGTDLYQTQLDMLEANPECVACMQNLLRVKDGDTMEKSWEWRQYDLKTGDKFDFENYVLKRRFISHPAFMFRRDEQMNVLERYGKFYDDEFQTMHHLQQGLTIYLDRADYVYVEYPTSLDNSYVDASKTARYLCMPFIYCHFWPEYTATFMKGNLQDIQSHLRSLIANKGEVSEDVRAYLSQFDGSLIRRVTILTKANKAWLICYRYLVLLSNKCRNHNDFLCTMLYKLAK